MHRPVILVSNRLLQSLSGGDYGPLTPHLIQVDLERGRLLYDPGDRIDTVNFPMDGVISLMTLMESGAAIESATIGREGALGLMAAVAPRKSLSRALVQTPARAARISAAQLDEAWPRSRDLVDRHNEALTQEFLADMLGVGRTMVTAVARALQAKGVIRGNYERLPPAGR